MVQCRLQDLEQFIIPSIHVLTHLICKMNGMMIPSLLHGGATDCLEMCLGLLEVGFEVDPSLVLGNRTWTTTTYGIPCVIYRSRYSC